MIIHEPRVIVFYFDINGFTSWSRRVKRVQVRNLLRDTYAIYDRWAKENKFWIKKQADGCIAVRELLPTNDRATIVETLKAAHRLTLEVNVYLKDLPFPRPTMVRCRGSLGDVWRLCEASGRVDYAGDPMNLGRRMLDIVKDWMFMISEGVYDSVGRRSYKNLKIERIEVGEVKLIGVDEEDQRNFYSFEVKEK